MSRERWACAPDHLLLRQSRALGCWCAWHFHDPVTGWGFVQVFGIRSPERAKRLDLRRLEPNSPYQCTDAHTGDTFETPGANLTFEGLKSDLRQMSSQVLVYPKSR